MSGPVKRRTGHGSALRHVTFAETLHIRTVLPNIGVPSQGQRKLGSYDAAVLHLTPQSRDCPLGEAR